jgi:protein-L-isoaspartate(D-aspartate) O-methyltransferase
MTADFSEQRAKMVDGQLRTTEVTNPNVLAAMLSVPRELFVPPRWRELAYIDEDILVSGPETEGGARYLMQASPFARLVQLAKVTPADLVLDVGCGTGYSSAVLSQLAGSVIALESDAVLAERATSILSSLDCANVAVVQGPLHEGYPSEAPYDVIFLNGAVDRLPEPLFQQLRDGGRLVAIEGTGNAGAARLYMKEHGIISSMRDFNAAVKQLPGFQVEPEFEF